MTAPAEREGDARAALLKAYSRLVPGIVGNPFAVQWPTPKQALFLAAHQQHREAKVYECLFGGAAGPGKSSALLLSAAQYVQDPEFHCLILRRTFAELSKPGAIMDRAIEWWRPRGAAWDGQSKTFRFPSGAKVVFGYLQHEHDHLQYQGAEFHQTNWDELTQFPRESQYRYIGISRVRRREGCRIPLRSLSTSNPGGPGHEWVKARFIGDPDNGIGAPCIYIPAQIGDNPHIDQGPYIEGLMHLHPTTREQLLRGDWRAREPGDYFRRDWFGPLLSEADKMPTTDSIRVRWWDLAASEKADAARTAGVLMARGRYGVRVVEHAVAFRATPGRRDDLIVQQAQTDGFAVTVGLEIEPGSGGQAQFETLGGRLRSLGYRVVGQRPRVAGPDLSDRDKALLSPATNQQTGKAGRADPVASCLERGHQRRGECPDTGGIWWGMDRGKPVLEQCDGLRLVAGPWTQMYLDEVEGFPDAATCDLVDATSGAWAYLEARPMGGVTPPNVITPKRHPSPDIHPEMRGDDAPKGKRYTAG